MEQIEIQIADGDVRIFPRGILPRDILKELPGNGEKEKIVSAKFSGSPWDLQTPLERSGRLEWVTLNSPEGVETLRHSTSHVMAQAVKSLFPGAKITIGPAIKDGFYYDFDLDHHFSPEDFPRIEEKMRKIIADDLPLGRRVMGREEAIRYFQERGESYKAELISELLRRHGKPLSAGGVCRPLSGASSVLHRTDSGVQADEFGRRLLAGRRTQ